MTNGRNPAFKAGFKYISDITIERNKRVVARLDETAANAAEREAKQFGALPGLAPRTQCPAFRAGFKVYRLASLAFRVPNLNETPRRRMRKTLKRLMLTSERKKQRF